MRASTADEAIRLTPHRAAEPRAGARVHQRRRAGGGHARRPSACASACWPSTSGRSGTRKPEPGRSLGRVLASRSLMRPRRARDEHERPARVAAREFLLARARPPSGAGLGRRLRAPAAAAARASIVGAGRFLDTDTGEMTYVLCLFDLDGSRSRTIDMDFFGHGLAFHPTGAAARGDVREEGRRAAARWTCAAGRVTRAHHAPRRSRAFYGHGAFSRDGQVLFATENHLETRNGLDRGPRREDLRGAGRVPHLRPEPARLPPDRRRQDARHHERRRARGRRDALPSVTFVDAASTKLLERLTFDDPAHQRRPPGAQPAGATSSPSRPRGTGCPTRRSGA